MIDFRITLEARNPARKCFRHYHVEAGTDLFGVWVVEIGYGRIGTAGRSRRYVVRDEKEARRLVQSILKRRASAPRRIGARAHVLYARQRALFYRDVLLPLRQRIVEQSLEQYNAMQLGVFQLLAAQRAQVAAGRGYIAALREYWTARARLGLVLAGGLVEPRAEPEGSAAAPTGTEADAGDGEAATLVGEP